MDTRYVALLIDMQPRYLRQREPLRDLLIRNQTTVLRMCAAQDTLVCRIETADQGKTIPKLRDALRGMRQQYVVKSDLDAFCRTDLDALIQAEGATHLLLMGVAASVCVRHTARGALGRYTLATSPGLIAECFGPVKREASLWYRRHARYLPTLAAVRAELSAPAPQCVPAYSGRGAHAERVQA